jgi:opacity protein-like surface antigen
LGQNTSGFDATIGVRIYDTFRLEASYVNLRADYDAFELTGNTAFLNAIFDARMDSIYRLFHSQRIIPYVGFGAGLSWNSASVTIENKITPAAAALAGFGVELGDRFALDFGYKYIYVFAPKFEVIPGLNPNAHMFRAGFRFNF